MKNLPEKDFWNVVKNRLDNYSESPDDDGWDKISGALPRTAPSFPAKRIAGMVLIFALGLMSGYLGHKYMEGSTNGVDATAITQDFRASMNDALPHEDATAELRKGDTEDTSDEQQIRTSDVTSPNGSNTDQVSTSQAESSAEEKKIKQISSGSSAHAHAEDKTKSKRVNGDEPRSLNDREGLSGSNPAGLATSQTGLNVHSSDQGSKLQTPSSKTGSDTVGKMDDSNAAYAVAPDNDQRKTTRGDADIQVPESRYVESAVLVTDDESSPSQDASHGKGSSARSVDPTDSVQSAVVKKDLAEQKQTPATVASVKREEKSKKEKRIFHGDLYVNFTPSLSFQKISPSGSDNIRVVGLESEGVMSSDRLGISLEAGFQRRLSPKVEMYAGLSYYQQRQRLGYQYNTSDVVVDRATNGGYEITPVVGVKEFNYNMTNVGVSSGVFYHLTGNQLMHKIGGGLQFQKGLLAAGAEDSYNNSKSWYLNYQLSYRIECKLNPKLNVYLQPTFIHAIIAEEALSEPFTIKPYRAGLGFGAIYRF